ncbi:MAG: ABC transporter substrate-binding protein [Christensenellales bacterium]|jgi:raffinose/stachyose/melibiose transport system substrate-binding protein
MLRKRFLALALALVMLLGLAAFAQAEEVIELRVLNYLNMTSPNTAEEQKVVWEAFEAAHPNIKLVMENEFNEPFHQAVEAYAAVGNLPDVIYVWPSGRSTTLHTKKLLKDLAPLAERDGLSEFYNPLVLDPAQQVGGYLAMLSNGVTATHTFLANLEVLEDAGLEPAKTYSELVAQVPVLKAKGYETVLMPNQDTWVMQSCLFSMVAGRFCGEGWEQRILNGEAKFTDPDFLAALNFIKQIYEDKVIDPSTLAVGYGEGPGLFATNTAAYYIDGDWRVGDFITDQSTGEALMSPEKQAKIQISVFPEIDVEGVQLNRTNTAVLATGYGINAALEDGSPKLEAAWELVKWLVGKDVLTYRLATGGLGTPSRTDIDYTSLTLEPMQVALANLAGEYDKATVVIDGVFEGPVYTPLNDGLQAIGYGRETPEQVAQATQDAFDAWKSAK